jgi:hypothetical protein
MSPSPTITAAPHEQPAAAPAASGGCGLRILWMGVGPAALAVTARTIYEYRTGWLSWADVVFWLLVAGMLVLRRLDILRFHGLSIRGLPTTPADWRRYRWLLPTGCAAIWLAAHLAARLAG